jgi:putative long chain acyl-CoA synthase
VGLLNDLVVRPVARAGAAAQNALEVARFGGLETGEEPAPYEIAIPAPPSCSCRR